MTLYEFNKKKIHKESFLIFFSKDTLKKCLPTWEVVENEAKKIGIEIIKIESNTDSDKNLKMSCFVKCYPTTVYFLDGVLTKHIEGNILVVERLCL